MDVTTGIILLSVAAVATIVIIGIVKKMKAKEAADLRRDRNPYTRAAKLLAAGTSVFTPKGAKVFPEAGVSVSEADKAAMDAGLDRVFDRVLCHYPNGAGHKGLTHGEYEICVFQSELTPGGNYAFRVDSNGYKGTEWEQIDPKTGESYIFAGAMVTGVVGESYTMSIPDQKGRTDVISNAVDYEAEHWLLATFDAEKYEATKIHGAGQGHPIIGPCPQTASAFAAVPPSGKEALSHMEGEVFQCILPVK